jgi:hypothetical protein
MRFLFLIGIIFSILVPVPALAQIAPTLEFSGLAISPFLIETQIQPGESQVHTITLFNTTDAPLPFDISINDFTVEKRTGQAKFLTTGESGDPRYSLSSWVVITNQPDFTLLPKAQTEIKFTITAPKDAEPGTHYGGILFARKPGDVSGSGPKVTQKVGAIILAKLGQAKEQGRIANFYTETRGSSQERTFALTFQNIGNVHLKPKGEVYIHNIFGQKVGNIYVNRDAENVLPETERDFSSVWTPSKWAFGRYTATATLYFGNPKIQATETISFWILPWKQLVLAVIIVMFALIGMYKGVKAYNRWIVRRNRAKN